jgi:tripartite-type tricarboxylate transporter receptor subunit TctC
MRTIMNRRELLKSSTALSLTSLSLMNAWAQKYPSGPVNLILPLQAGSASDVAIRFLAERLSNRMGAGFVVENIAAAAGLVGLEKILRSKNDGSTVAALNNSIMTILPHLQAKNMKSDTRKDFVAVGGVANIPTFFAVPSTSSIQSVQDLVKFAKSDPNRVTYSSGGIGSPQHLATEMFKSFTNTKLVHVPYRGASQAAVAVAAGEVEVMSMALSLAQPFLAGNRVRLIGYCGTERHAQYKDIPTLQEQGVANYDYSSWVALFFNKEVPIEIVQTLRRETMAIAQDNDFQQQLIKSGLEPWARTAQQLEKIVDEDFVRWRKIIQEANIQSS